MRAAAALAPMPSTAPHLRAAVNATRLSMMSDQAMHKLQGSVDWTQEGLKVERTLALAFGHYHLAPWARM